MAFKKISDLGRMVDERIIVVVTLGDLRKAINYERLGKYVLDEISSSLEGEGLGYFPLDAIDANPEPRQWEEVRVYRRGKGIGKVIQAVTSPTPAGDRMLRENSGQGMELIQQIRALICPDPPNTRGTT